MQFGEKLYVQPGLQIEALSNTKVFLPDAAPGLSNFDIKRTYLRIPLMVGYQIGLSDVFRETEGLNSGVRNNVFYANGGLKFKL